MVNSSYNNGRASVIGLGTSLTFCNDYRFNESKHPFARIIFKAMVSFLHSLKFQFLLILKINFKDLKDNIQILDTERNDEESLFKGIMIEML